MTCKTCGKEMGWLAFGEDNCFGCHMGTGKAPAPKKSEPAPVVNRGQAVLIMEEPTCQP